jgi:hypothetical protein
MGFEITLRTFYKREEVMVYVLVLNVGYNRIDLFVNKKA